MISCDKSELNPRVELRFARAYLLFVQFPPLLLPLNPVPLQSQAKVEKRFMHLPPFAQGVCLFLTQASTHPEATSEERSTSGS